MKKVNRFVQAARLSPAAALLLTMISGAGAQVSLPAPVERGTLATDAFSAGAPSKVIGTLPSDLWRGAAVPEIAALLHDAPAAPSTPGVGEALRRTLLSPGTAPTGSTPALGGLKLRAFARSGSAEEARTIASLSNAPQSEPFTAEALATADLLSDATAAACGRGQRLADGRDTPFWLKLRVLCYAAAGETDAAGLTLDLLREQGELGSTDEAFLTPLAFGGALTSPPPPETALHLAILRRLKSPITLTARAPAEGGVLRAIATDSNIDPATRVIAALNGAAAGIMSAADLDAVFQSLTIVDAEVANAASLAAARPDDPMTDVLLHRSIRLMQAPEFLRDKAGRISLALDLATSFPRAVAAARLYEVDLKALQGALVPASEAANFARARLIVGDANGAAQWLLSMLGGGTAQGLAAPEAQRFSDLVSLLDILDPVVAGSVAEAGGIKIEKIEPTGAGQAQTSDPAKLARILNAAFAGAAGGSAGLSALAGIAASDMTGVDDPVASIVLFRALEGAGLGDLARRVRLERVLLSRLTPEAPRAASVSSAESAPQPVAQPARQPRERSRTPRLKPPPGR